jgi:hypothetical protein
MLWGEVGLVRSVHSLPKSPCKVLLYPHNKLLCVQTEIKNYKIIIQAIMVSTRSSDYAAIGGGGNGIRSGSQLSRRLARGPPPIGEEEEDNNSTPVAFDVNDGDCGKVEVNSECKGNGNSDCPIDNNDDDDYDIHDDNNNDNNNDGDGVGQKRKRGAIVEEREEIGRGGEGGGGCVCDVLLEQEE